jgi:hypothetical protein
VRAPSLHVPVQLLGLVDFEFARVLNAAARAVVQAVVPVDCGVGGGEEVLRLSRLRELAAFLRRRHFRRRQRRRQLVGEVSKHCGHSVRVHRPAWFFCRRHSREVRNQMEIRSPSLDGGR